MTEFGAYSQICSIFRREILAEVRNIVRQVDFVNYPSSQVVFDEVSTEYQVTVT